ncbi:MAG: hypothetical protein R3E89_14045 [Thiolinea sp.]
MTRQDNVLLAADYRLMASQELQSPFLLRASSYAHSARDIQLDPYVRQLACNYPTGLIHAVMPGKQPALDCGQ